MLCPLVKLVINTRFNSYHSLGPKLITPANHTDLTVSQSMHNGHEQDVSHTLQTVT